MNFKIIQALWGIHILSERQGKKEISLLTMNYRRGEGHILRIFLSLHIIFTNYKKNLFIPKIRPGYEILRVVGGDFT